MKNLIFFGPPGAGKGTQAKIISQHIKLPHLSTGDILRKKITQKDKLATELKEILSSGKLVSDEILNKIVEEKLTYECKNGFILDGYPRTLQQADFLNKYLSISSKDLNYIFFIDIKFDILKERILKRSKEEGRDDDNIDIFKTRYNEYLETTKKVCDYYKSINPKIFIEIDGNDEISNITSKIKKIIDIS